MSDPETGMLLDQVEALERRVDGLRRWAVAATVVAGVALLLSCSGVGVGVVLLSQRVHVGPAPVQQVGQPVTAETPLAPGRAVLAEWGNRWWPAEVVAVEADGRVKVHFTGWDAAFDEAVPRERLRLPPQPAGE
jgi:hypothetical protein